jgi:hypothetical protein
MFYCEEILSNKKTVLSRVRFFKCVGNENAIPQSFYV